MGDLDAAAAALRSAIDADSTCGLAYHRLSVIQTLRHDDSSALAAVNAGLARSDRLDRQSLTRLKAQRHFVLGYGDSAIAAFQDAVLDDETDIDAWYGLGEALFHFGAFAAHSPLDARAAFDRVAALDSSFTPVYDHLLELALQADDRRGAEGYLRRLRVDDPWRPMREAFVALQFRSGQDRSAALSRLQSDGTPCAVAGGYLRDAWRAQARSGRYSCRLLPWGQPDPGRSTQGRAVPSRRLGRTGALVRGGKRVEVGHDRPSLRCLDGPGGARGFPLVISPSRVCLGEATDGCGTISGFPAPLLDEVRQAFDALVDRATLEGDSAEVIDSCAGFEELPPEVIQIRVRRHFGPRFARLALLAGDTTRAVGLLQRAVSQIAEPWTANYPLTAMGPQRYLLAELLRTRGDSSQARRWQDSFSNSWAIADVLYLARMGRLERRPAN